MYGAIAYSLIRRHSHPYHKGLRWVPANNGEIPEYAVPSGHLGGSGGEEMYVGRVRLQSEDIIPGNVIPSKKCCFASLEGRGMPFHDYEVLTNYRPDEVHVSWIHAKNGHTPDVSTILKRNSIFCSLPFFSFFFNIRELLKVVMMLPQEGFITLLGVEPVKIDLVPIVALWNTPVAFTIPNKAVVSLTLPLKGPTTL